MIAPGIERVDTVKTEDGYEMKSIWCRSDLSDTSMLLYPGLSEISMVNAVSPVSKSSMIYCHIPVSIS